MASKLYNSELCMFLDDSEVLRHLLEDEGSQQLRSIHGQYCKVLVNLAFIK